MYKIFILALLSLQFFGQAFAATVSPMEAWKLAKFTSCEEMKKVVSQSTTPVPQPLAMTGEMAPTASIAKMADGIGWSGDVSQTNVQIIGVDEGDMVKTDGTYIYAVQDQALTITRARPVDMMKVVQNIKLPFAYTTPSLYLSNGLLIIVGSSWDAAASPVADQMVMPVSQATSSVTIFDIKNPEKPRLLRYFTTTGNMIQSRVKDGVLYLISQSYTMPIYGAYREGMTGGGDITMSLPKNTDTRLVGIRSMGKFRTFKTQTRCQDVEYFKDAGYTAQNFITLSVIPLNITGTIQQKTFLSDVQNIFMSQDSLVLVGTYWKQGGNFTCPPNARCLMPVFRSEMNSLLHMFQLKNGAAHYAQTVLVPGTPLSQYALHDYKGTLFTAQQRDWSEGNGVDIFAIDTRGKLLSKLENIGVGERFQAARYIDSRLYLVTFEQMDPLFVIDLTNPQKMSVLGELTMPGYSTYLHPYDATHLIGLGYATETNQWGGVNNGGLKIDLYDVGDVHHPKQVFSEVFGGMGSSAEALSNPRALLWDVTKKILHLPAQLMTQDPKSYQFTAWWQGLLSVSIDAKNGIKKVSQISHIDQTDIGKKRREECAQYTQGVTTDQCYTHVTTGEKICVKPADNPTNGYIPAYCYAEYDDQSYLASTIWNYYPAFIQRAVYIGDVLYTLSAEKIQANTYRDDYALLRSIQY
jgi:inhibitor of cysteine peptidase